MNRIQTLFQNKAGHILSVYFTAGYPKPGSTVQVIRNLAATGVDMIEVGMPFSDPMADGPVIQKSSDTALKNGMSLTTLFSELRDIRKDVHIPLLLMGYLNPVMQYGIERFCADCERIGIDGLILPDLPLEVFTGDAEPVAKGLNGTLQQLFERHNLHNIFLISPQTPVDRIRYIDRVSKGFIYMVSSSSTTGIRGGFDAGQTGYFERINGMGLQNATLIGFGISDHSTFEAACQYAKGAIIGSAFVRLLGTEGWLDEIPGFVSAIRGK